MTDGQGQKQFYELYYSLCVRMLFRTWVITLHSQLYKESPEIFLPDVILHNHCGAPETLYSFYHTDTGKYVTDHSVSLLELIAVKRSQIYHFLWQACWFYNIHVKIKLILTQFYILIPVLHSFEFLFFNAILPNSYKQS